MSRIRIIGGEWRSRLIDVPESIGLRPTPDRVRETVFNWLGQDLSGKRCLDLFAGSGALGFEAASRGASEVVMVEAAPKVAAHLRRVAAQFGDPRLKVMSGDAMTFLSGVQAPFDVIFLDPPYRQGWIEKLAPRLEALLVEEGRVYVESEGPIEHLGQLISIKSRRAGQVHYQLFGTAAGEEDEHD